MAVGVHRVAQLEINQAALQHNIAAIKSLWPKQKLLLVVKANAYGHGAVQVAQVGKKAGADGFCVALLDEAIELRKAGLVDDPILVLGVTDIDAIYVAQKYDISVIVTSLELLRTIHETFKTFGNQKPIRIHLPIDTGMGRLGLRKLADIEKYIEILNLYPNEFVFEGMFSHFSTSDEVDQSYFKQQVEKFKQILTKLDELPPYVSLANSAAAIWHPELNKISNAIRYGISACGIDPSDSNLKLPFELEETMQLTSELVYVKQVGSNESIGYGATYTTHEPEWIATIPVGYADGYSRRMAGFYVLVNGQKMPIVGRICMDQLMIRLPKAYPAGTKVTLMGTGQGAQISAQAIADHCGTIPHEIFCNFSARLPRVYH